MSENNFLVMLRNNRLPWYITFETDPKLYLKKYRFNNVIVSRKIKTGSIVNKQVIQLTRKKQDNIFLNLCKLKQIYPYTIAVSSEPTDFLAMNTAATIVFNLYKKFKCDFKFINSNYTDKESDLINYKIIVIHNVVAINHYERLYKIRDLVLKYPKALKIVVVGGTNGLDFFDNYLRTPLSSMLHVVTGPHANSYLKYPSKPNNDLDFPVFTEEIRSLIKPIVKKATVKRE